jgi:hypothetical protein
MNVGMLWFDGNKDTELKLKVQKAAEYYQRKYGIEPTVCYVNPAMMDGERQSAGRVEVRSNATVLPNHFWIGVNGKNESNGQQSG